MGVFPPHAGNLFAEQARVDLVAGRTTTDVLADSFVRVAGVSGVPLERFHLRATDSFGVGKVVRETSLEEPE